MPIFQMSSVVSWSPLVYLSTCGTQLCLSAAAHRRWSSSETLDRLELASASLSANCMPSTWFRFPIVSKLVWIRSVSCHALWREWALWNSVRQNSHTINGCSATQVKSCQWDDNANKLSGRKAAGCAVIGWGRVLVRCLSATVHQCGFSIDGLGNVQTLVCVSKLVS